MRAPPPPPPPPRREHTAAAARWPLSSANTAAVPSRPRVGMRRPAAAAVWPAAHRRRTRRTRFTLVPLFLLLPLSQSVDGTLTSLPSGRRSPALTRSSICRPCQRHCAPCARAHLPWRELTCAVLTQGSVTALTTIPRSLMSIYSMRPATVRARVFAVIALQGPGKNAPRMAL